MIWQYNVRVVVMLTNVVEVTDRFTSIKCNKYWPDNVGDAKKFGDLKVQLFDRAEVSVARLYCQVAVLISCPLTLPGTQLLCPEAGRDQGGRGGGGEQSHHPPAAD